MISGLSGLCRCRQCEFPYCCVRASRRSRVAILADDAMSCSHGAVRFEKGISDSYVHQADKE